MHKKKHVFQSELLLIDEVGLKESKIKKSVIEKEQKSFGMKS